MIRCKSEMMPEIKNQARERDCGLGGITDGKLEKTAIVWTLFSSKAIAVLFLPLNMVAIRKIFTRIFAGLRC